MGLHHMDDRLAILENLHAFQIDGLKVLNNIFIIGTTNRKELIDEALLRIELHVKVEYPDEQGRLQILGIYTRNMRQNFVLDKDVNLHEIGKTNGCSGSALASLVTRAHSYAVVHTGENGLLQHVKNDFKVTMNHFLCAIEDVKSRLQESDLESRSCEGCGWPLKLLYCENSMQTTTSYRLLRSIEVDRQPTIAQVLKYYTEQRRPRLENV
ncbi:Vesicular-fusion protein sec18 [Camellia lanceoleosa]|uniref:Vesicular-fusion protein sec18 n=1 Tax=Camellia lanceoleosa TaxID=1840588 RepID=A0ACC0HMT5_9ERIC|nr:Vesicular-fusion protein sec18 [Camellia lanceoleosa]